MRSVFINAMSAASVKGAGTLTFTFTKSNVPSPVTFDIAVDVANSDDELTIANKIWNGLNTGLSNNNALYNGTPAFLTDIYTPFTFQIIRTNHMISVWSEASYTLGLDNTSDAQVHLSTAPIYATLSDVKAFAPISGVRLSDMNNSPLNDEQIILSAKAASATNVSMFNGFNIIPTTYLQVESGEWMRGVCCRYAPVISRSPVQAQGPYTANYSNFLSVSTVQRIQFDPYTGMMWFLDWSNSIGIREATEFGNCIIWSYIAGHEFASESLLQAAVKLLGLAKIPSEISEFHDASFGMKFKDPQQAYGMVMNQLAQFQV